MSLSRPFAQTLADCSFTYQPNTVAGNQPVTIGHAYSVIAFLPEKSHPNDPPWVLPLLTRRVQSTEKAIVVGAEQLEMLLDDDQRCVPLSLPDISGQTPGFSSRMTRIDESHECLLVSFGRDS